MINIVNLQALIFFLVMFFWSIPVTVVMVSQLDKIVDYIAGFSAIISHILILWLIIIYVVIVTGSTILIAGLICMAIL